MSDSVELHLGSERFSYPILTGTENERAVDIAKLRDETGLITLDPAYKNTGATKSAITFIDGDLGILRYRGYPIEQLAEHSSFMEVSYLLLYGELPSAVQLEQFNQSIIRRTLVHENIKKFLDAYPGGTHPMGVLMSTIASLSSFYPNSLIPNRSAEDVDRTIHRLIAKMATIAAWTYKKAIGHPYMYPNNKYDYVSNFLMMMFGHRTEEYVPDPVVVDALNKLLILHADHEQNCSTSTVRIVGSSHANIYASVAAGIGALWGPLHGGANQAVIEMLEAIKDDGGDAQKYIAKAKDKNDPFRLMGFGH
ncbi:MAG: citrate (Si)-synthase, partial [Bacteroidetes bacterium]|nr:citrate (Si)-synthase [Bacteroidota bacterium]